MNKSVKKQSRNNSENSVFYVYILECANNTYYTGQTNNIQKRYKDHVNGKANSKYTKAFKVTRLVQCWKLKGTRGTALKVEYFIKKLNKKTKILLAEKPLTLKTMLLKKRDLNIKINPFKFIDKTN